MPAKTRAIAGDVLLAAALTAVTISAAVFLRPETNDALTVVLSVLTAAPIALRQVVPIVTLSIVLGAQLALTLLNGSAFPEGGLALVIAAFTVATHCPRRVALTMYALTLVVIGGCTIALAGRSIPSAVLWSELLKGVVAIVVAGVLGLSTKRWAERAERLAARAERAAANERVRIARELHDVVAHHMSVISLQAGVSRYLLDTDVVAARSALATVEEASREALSEMRRLLDVLRPQETDFTDAPYGAGRTHGTGGPNGASRTHGTGGLNGAGGIHGTGGVHGTGGGAPYGAGRTHGSGGPNGTGGTHSTGGGGPDGNARSYGSDDYERSESYAPQPGLADLDRLVERTRAAGVPVELAVSGPVRPLAPGPDLCAYRVVQESLTNVLKHAGPANVRIDVTYGGSALTLRVVDDGRGSGSAESGGHGIRGMRERAELYGGVLDAGPRDEGGFGVVARLPIGEGK
ncbi:sensor histidine kinase [Cryptosporangium phraense]|uniref:histidine kinase n=1 Tax=Cryptosporangium phraense TaxID=2593070 RepID=A0A545AUN8_9ACTN|nr:histidine kinase [Cryptosporangium phraense]TQS45046.1 hypothetical protein FL583_11140 [Cryptosporangium phraense]